jgi:hypothetical protein
MLDPLRSLAELVRTLTRSRSEKRGGSAAPAQRVDADADEAGTTGRSAAPGRSELLRERLRTRLRTVGTTNRRAAREAFVETVLASELGEAITLDPAMTEIVVEVSRQLGSDAATDRELGLLLEELAGDPR